MAARRCAREDVHEREVACRHHRREAAVEGPLLAGRRRPRTRLRSRHRGVVGKARAGCRGLDASQRHGEAERARREAREGVQRSADRGLVSRRRIAGRVQRAARGPERSVARRHLDVPGGVVLALRRSSCTGVRQSAVFGSEGNTCRLDRSRRPRGLGRAANRCSRQADECAVGAGRRVAPR